MVAALVLTPACFQIVRQSEERAAARAGHDALGQQVNDAANVVELHQTKDIEGNLHFASRQHTTQTQRVLAVLLEFLPFISLRTIVCVWGKATK